MNSAIIDLALLGKIKEIYDKFKNTSIPRLETNIVLSHTVFRGTFKHGNVIDESTYGYVITRNQDMVMYVVKMSKSDAIIDLMVSDQWYVFDDKTIMLLKFDEVVSYDMLMSAIKQSAINIV